jgi:Flp pilus assembly protein TadD
MIFDLQNRPDDAEGAYRRALEVNPSAPVAANNLAYRYAESNHNLDEALALARTAAAHLKDQPEVLDTLGWVHYRKGQLKEAISQFEASAQKDPANPMYHYHLGLAYAQAGEKAKARLALSEALRLSPSFDGAGEAKRILASLQS